MDGIWIIGYRDFGFEVADVAQEAGYAIAGYVQYDASEKQEERREARILPIDEMTPGAVDRFVCAMTSTLLRQSLVERIAAGSTGTWGVCCLVGSIPVGTKLTSRSVIVRSCQVGRKTCFGTVSKPITGRNANSCHCDISTAMFHVRLRLHPSVWLENCALAPAGRRFRPEITGFSIFY